MTPKDRADLNFMLDLGVDWIALSFVQRPEDIVEMKGLIMSHNPNNAFPPHIMAKIEKVSFPTSWLSSKLGFYSVGMLHRWSGTPSYNVLLTPLFSQVASRAIRSSA